MAVDAVLPARVWHRGMRWKALIEGEIRDDNPDVFWCRVISRRSRSHGDGNVLCGLLRAEECDP